LKYWTAYGSTLLSIYRGYSGGKHDQLGSAQAVVPYVRINRHYRIETGIAQGDGIYDVARDTLLSDTFWYQDHSVAGVPGSANTEQYPVRIGWCHGEKFNVCRGDGSVRAVKDDDNETIYRNTNSPTNQLPNNDRYHYAAYAEIIWDYFDTAQ